MRRTIRVTASLCVLAAASLLATASPVAATPTAGEIASFKSALSRDMRSVVPGFAATQADVRLGLAWCKEPKPRDDFLFALHHRKVIWNAAASHNLYTTSLESAMMQVSNAKFAERYLC